MAASNPVLEDIPADVWKKVLTNVKTGFVHILIGDSIYYQTYRLTGEDAPIEVAGDPDFDGVPIYYRNERITDEFVPLGTAGINSVAKIDVYIYSKGAAGRVRVDEGL